MQHLGACLESVRWAEAVLLLHLSAEAPPALPGSHSALMVRKLASLGGVEGFCKELGTDWILHLWGEEVVGAELRDEISALCRRDLAASPQGYRIAIRSQLLGCWVQGSLLGPSPAPRLSRRAEEIAPGWWNSGRTQRAGYPAVARGWIGDYSAAALDNGLRRIEDISGLWKERLEAAGAQPGLSSYLLTPLQAWSKTLLSNGIWAGGIAGMTLATLAAYAPLLTAAKLWEARHVKPNAKGKV